MKTCEILIYGFNTKQSEEFDKSLHKECFFITSEPVKKDLLETKYLHKNILEMMDSDESNQIYSKVIKYYKEKKAKLPYEEIEKYLFPKNLILSSIHLMTRWNLSSLQESVRFFRKSFNLAVHLFETLEFKTILMRTGPQSMFSLILYSLSDQFGVRVIYGDPVNYGIQRWMLGGFSKSGMESGLRPNLTKEMQNEIINRVFDSEIKPDRRRIFSISTSDRLPLIWLVSIVNYFHNLIFVIFRFSFWFYLLVRQFFETHYEHSYGGKYRIRSYWLANIKDLIRIPFLHLFYNFKSLSSWKRYKKLKLAEKNKVVLVLANLQPEKTSNPDTLTYFDLEDVIDSIKTRISDDPIILFKEHPTTFFRLREFNGPIVSTMFRSRDFYRKLGEGGFLAPIEVDTGELIEEVDSIYTISSSAILDYHIKKSLEKEKSDYKNFYVFGDRWYGSLKNVHTIYDDGTELVGSLSLNELLSRQLSNGFFTTDSLGAYGEQTAKILSEELNDFHSEN